MSGFWLLDQYLQELVGVCELVSIEVNIQKTQHQKFPATSKTLKIMCFIFTDLHCHRQFVVIFRLGDYGNCNLCHNLSMGHSPPTRAHVMDETSVLRRTMSGFLITALMTTLTLNPQRKQEQIFNYETVLVLNSICS